jgi:hypothetical protein
VIAAIHIHEDDWGMRSLHPAAAGDEVAADLAESAAASERNRAPSGVGWTDIHLIGAPSVSYADVGLELAAAAAALASVLPRIKIFKATTGGAIGSGRDPYGSHETEAWCFGHGSHCFVKLEPAGALVRSIWFELRGADRDDAAALRKAIEAVDALAPSIIADYRLKAAGPVGEPAFLDAYFAAHAQNEAAIAELIEELQRRDPTPPVAPHTPAPPPKGARRTH